MESLPPFSNFKQELEKDERLPTDSPDSERETLWEKRYNEREEQQQKELAFEREKFQAEKEKELAFEREKFLAEIRNLQANNKSKGQQVSRFDRHIVPARYSIPQYLLLCLPQNQAPPSSIHAKTLRHDDPGVKTGANGMLVQNTNRYRLSQNIHEVLEQLSMFLLGSSNASTSKLTQVVIEDVGPNEKIVYWYFLFDKTTVCCLLLRLKVVKRTDDEIVILVSSVDEEGERRERRERSNQKQMVTFVSSHPHDNTTHRVVPQSPRDDHRHRHQNRQASPREGYHCPPPDSVWPNFPHAVC